MSDRPRPDRVAERFAQQIDYLDRCAGQSVERFRRFRTSHVAVLGEDAVAQACALSLIRNGCEAVAFRGGAGEASRSGPIAAQVEDLAAAGCAVVLLPVPRGEVTWHDLRGYDVVVTTGGSRQVAVLLAAGVPGGVSLLPLTLVGRRAFVGPLTRRGRRGCWGCARLRLGGERGAGGGGVDGTAGTAGVAGVAGTAGMGGSAGVAALSRPQAALLGNLLAFEVFRLTSGARPAGAGQQVIVQDLDSRGCRTEWLAAHPRCPYCGGAGAAAGH